jgi:hypothetical protein
VSPLKATRQPPDAALHDLRAAAADVRTARADACAATLAAAGTGVVALWRTAMAWHAADSGVRSRQELLRQLHAQLRAVEARVLLVADAADMADGAEGQRAIVTDACALVEEGLGACASMAASLRAAFGPAPDQAGSGASVLDAASGQSTLAPPPVPAAAADPEDTEPAHAAASSVEEVFEASPDASDDSANDSDSDPPPRRRRSPPRRPALWRELAAAAAAGPSAREQLADELRTVLRARSDRS